MLWAHVAAFTETSYESEYDVLAWIVSRDDCEAAIARDIWAHLHPEPWQLRPAEEGLGEDISKPWCARVLRRIAERSEGRGFPTGRLGSGFHRLEDLLDRAPSFLEWIGDPRIVVPGRLLQMRLRGPELDRRACMVDFEGLHGRPSDFNLPEGAGR